MQEKSYRNIADRLGLATDPAVHRLLRACGVEERLITGGASDRERFDALAAALPLCEGHTIATRLTRLAQESAGLACPLCPHTAGEFWDAWVERYWYGCELPTRELPSACPLCAPCQPTALMPSDLTHLPDPLTLSATDLPAWMDKLEALVKRDAATLLWRLPADYAFLRPDPYHAEEALKVAAQGQATPRDKSLLWSQALRTVGLVAREADRVLLLQGGDPAEITALLAYLHSTRALPHLVWIPDRPADAGAISGLYGSVRTGLCLPADPQRKTEAIAAYAAVAPIGRAVTL